MPTDLAALLLEEGAVSPEALERALERQREEGGALDTALLEERAIAEERLVGYLAAAAELPPAPPEAWRAADARARRVFPSRVAERHGLAPFALDGRELALVATYPVDLTLLDEISFMLSLHLTAHVAPEWRVRALIHRLYDTPLAPRLAALAAEDGASLEAVPEPTPAPDEEHLEPAQRSAPLAPSGFSRDESEPLEPLAAALQQALEADGGALFEELASSGAAERRDARGGDGGDRGEAEPREDQPAEEAEEGDRPPPDRSAPPGWRLDDARAALAAARNRDEVVLVALRHARDYFAYAAVLAVTRDALAGHDALGPDEDERERARSIAIWASDPGMLRTVLETRSPYIGPVDREAAGTDAIVSGLGREAARTVLLFPVLLRDRPVCLLYADNGRAPISVRRLGDLLLLLSGVGPALERIILARKERPPAGGAVPASPSAGSGEGSAEPPPERGEEAARPAVEPERSPAPPPEQAHRPAAIRAEAALSPIEVDVDLDDLAPEAPPAETGGASTAGEEGNPAAAGSAETWLDEGDDAGAPPAAVEPIRAGASAPAAAARPDSLEEAFFSGAGDDAEPAAGEPPPEAEPPPAPAREVRAAPPAPVSAPLVATAREASPPPPAPEHEAPRGAAHEPEAPSLAALAESALEGDDAAAEEACEALARRRRDPGMRPAHEKLRRALLSGISVRSRRAARALGAVRDAEAIPLLIQVLETSEPATAAEAADALAAVTLHRLGPDARRWLAWWKENRGRGRAEWLFSGLTSPERETRVAASVELSMAAPPPVAYSADLPPAEREQAARAWAVWWARSGLVL